MFQRLGKRKMSADETVSQREKELRQTVAQLREQVEEEKSARKRAQYEKVRHTCQRGRETVRHIQGK